MGNVVLRERGRKYVGLPEFARAGEQVLAELGLEQARGTVTSVPDERTIRYYMAEGLVQTPEEKQGTASVFGYLNLLQLLTVKKLQAEHLPIRKIRELVAGKSEQELETLLGIGVVVGVGSNAGGCAAQTSSTATAIRSVAVLAKSRDRTGP
jgi:DNA-binding transcriptional MerR regulator